MKIFNTIRLATGETEIQQFQVDQTTDNIQMQIEHLQQAPDHDETVLMAEYAAENNLVLDYAIKYWLGYGLYHPEFAQLDQKNLQARFPKIILLKPNHPATETFAHVGRVVFDFDEYQHQVEQLLHWVPPLGDGD